MPGKHLVRGLDSVENAGGATMNAWVATTLIEIALAIVIALGFCWLLRELAAAFGSLLSTRKPAEPPPIHTPPPTRHQ